MVVDDNGKGTGTKVNIRVPMQLLRSGVKLAALIPVQARDHVNSALHEHGVAFDLSQIKPENFERSASSTNKFPTSSAATLLCRGCSWELHAHHAGLPGLLSQRERDRRIAVV